MASPSGKNTPLRGKTYSLHGEERDAGHYYELIRGLTDRFLHRCPDEQRLLEQVRNASRGRSFVKRLSGRSNDRHLLSFIKKTLRESLSGYTTGVRQHLRTLPLSRRFDPILRTKEEHYHLFMIEIELTNRIFRDAFRRSTYRFALIAHCLRDFRPGCRAEAGAYESLCRGCTKECLVHLGSVLLRKYGIHPYISVTMDLEKLFRKIRSEHDSVGALGIACVPELAMGMRLCIEMDIPPVGLPLDANRCARWMKEARDTSFSLSELENLLA
ncbi:MAG: DUF116 domain-containing protein [Nitrospiraceae bacterium]|nr:MAG: DUF116 domain-containing protein [Nitrospiraceae bacterium]